MKISPETEKLLRELKRKRNSKPEVIEEIKQEIKESLEGVEAVNEVFKRIELLKIKGDKGEDGERGNLFIGSFPTIEDLPDEKGFKQGDYAYIESEGEIWYIG
jgi:hypothetical protein